MSEILFVLEESDDGGWMAKAVGHSIVTEADSLADLRRRFARRWTVTLTTRTARH
jgi:hypothetical protein